MQYLRPEARPTGWERLDGAQQRAFRRSLQMIADAVDELNPPSRADPDRADVGAWLNKDRTTRSAFISGGRGTGKTTVLASLIEEYRTAGAHADRGTGPREPEGSAEVRDLLQELQGRLVWLEPIDMEPLPDTANLLMAILVRIETALCEIGQARTSPTEGGARPRGLLEPRPGYHGALMALQHLQTDIALAWDGNLPQRAASLDPDSFAVESMRTEKARLQLNRRLGEVLDCLADGFYAGWKVRDPLFILPVDDIDLNPAACLKLLTLLRMISVRRLFTLVLGDLRIVELVLNLKMSSGFGRLANGVGSLTPLADEVSSVSGEVAAHAMRKLVPPGQRIELSAMTLREAFNYRPLNYRDHDLRLHQLLEKCRMDLGSAAPEGAAACKTLRELLLVQGASLFTAPATPVENVGDVLGAEHLRNSVYRGRYLLQAPLRALTDLWFALRPLTSGSAAGDDGEAAKGAEPGAIIDTCARYCCSLLAEEPALSPQERRSAPQGLVRTETGEWLLRKLPISVGSIDRNYRVTEVPSASTGSEGPGHSLQIRWVRFEDWCFQTESHRALSLGTSAAVTVFHDLLALTRNPGELLGFDMSGSRWAVTEWSRQDLQFDFPWPAPRCLTFWDLEQFLFSWNDALEHHLTMDATEWDRFHRHMAFAWIAAGTAAIDRGGAIRYEAHPWKELFQRLKGLLSIAEGNRSRAEIARRWLIDVLLMLMPESGLHTSVAESLLKGHTQDSPLVRFWRSDIVWRAVRRRRGVWLARMYGESDMRTLAEELRDRCLPEPLNYPRFMPGKEYVKQLSQSSSTG